MAMRHFMLTISLIAGAFVTVFGREILPSTYFNDEQYIQQLLDRTAQSDQGSFAFTASAYSILGLAGSPLLAGIASFVLFLILIFKALRWSELCREGLPIFLTVCGSVLLGSVYLAQYSKEFLVMGLCLLFLETRRHWTLEALWLACALFYAYFVRDYWYLVVVLYVGFRLITWRTRGRTPIIIGVIAAYIGLTLIFESILGVPLVHFRTSVQLSLDATTMIDDPLTGASYLIQPVNAILVLGMLLVPYPLLMSFQLLQTILAGYLLLLGFALRRPFRSVLLRPRAVSVAADGVKPLCLIVAFLVVQSIFEPDYGSYIKHLLPMVPIALLTVKNAGESKSGISANLDARWDAKR